ncbi:hypothetical protein KHP62_05335 [Rhodobacteraceae bacterium NNCM2]|nr:hypothetical protein [Coraliihabitans acroporae]
MTLKQAILYSIFYAVVVYGLGLVYRLGAMLGVSGSTGFRVGLAIAVGVMSVGMMLLAQYLRNKRSGK